MSSFDQLRDLCFTNRFDWKFSRPEIFLKNFAQKAEPADDVYVMMLERCAAEGPRRSMAIGNDGFYEIAQDDFCIIEIKIARGIEVRLDHRTVGNGCGGFFFLVAEEGSSVVYNHNVSNEIGPVGFESISFLAEAGSRIDLNQKVATGSDFRSEISFFLTGEGSKIDGKIFHIGEASFFDCRTLQYHLGRNTISNLVAKFALKENANSSFCGKIIATETAIDSEARQLNKNIILSDSARTTSVPSMDIRNPGIKCYHGATVSEINSEQLFYLRSRGIDLQTAEQMIVDGFLEFY
ncbi:MAG: SufD family Fe-S cluster assembly protein [Puniceicoccales bacterium]|jgi:hypothetical protein|nr:SufD family Fe-S cluster assembly protein [Puniceicoccales bacterium]